jgi:hypothetical protein
VGCVLRWVCGSFSAFELLRGRWWAGGLVKSARERAEEKREAKLELVSEQVENGSLVIRQMTEEERRRYPPRPVEPKRPRRW